MKNPFEFLAWEQYTADAIDVKRVYIDIADDLAAGIVLSQIIYWNLPDKNGDSKLTVRNEEGYWLVISREEWWDQCRLRPKAADRAINILKSKGLIKTKVTKFGFAPKTHIQIIWDRFLEVLTETIESEAGNIASHYEDADLPDMGTSTFPDREHPPSHNRNMDLPDMGTSCKEENSLENSLKNSLEIPPSPQAPSPAPVQSAPAKRNGAQAEGAGGGEKQKGSSFSWEECLEFVSAQSGVKSREGFATTIFRTGEADDRMRRFFEARAGPPVDFASALLTVLSDLFACRYDEQLERFGRQFSDSDLDALDDLRQSHSASSTHDAREFLTGRASIETIEWLMKRLE